MGISRQEYWRHICQMCPRPETLFLHNEFCLTLWALQPRRGTFWVMVSQALPASSHIDLALACVWVSLSASSCLPHFQVSGPDPGLLPAPLNSFCPMAQVAVSCNSRRGLALLSILGCLWPGARKGQPNSLVLLLLNFLEPQKRDGVSMSLAGIQELVSP